MTPPQEPVPIRTRERDFEKLCQAFGVSGILLWSDPDAPPGARPQTGTHLHIAQKSDPAHRISFANHALFRLTEFRQWLRGLMTSR